MQARNGWSAAALAVLLVLTQGAAFGQAAAQSAASQEELLFWDTIKNSSNPADFQEYLKQYPNGRFAGLARIRARGTAPAPAPRAPAAAGAAAAVVAVPAGPAAFPVPGESWKYRFLDRQYSPRHPLQYEVRVVRADGGVITESLAPVGGSSKESALKVSELGFLPRPLPNTKLAMEFSPYWIWRTEAMPTPLRIRAGSGYPMDRNPSDWQVDITTALAPAPVAVAAGTFGGATRMELKGVRQTSNDMSRRNYEVSRFQVTAWYAKEAGRVLKIEHRAWYASGQPAGDEVTELLEHNVDPAAVAAAGQKGAPASPDLKIAAGLLPLQGETWNYRFTDKKYGGKVQPFSVRVEGVQGSVVSESIEPAGAKLAQRSVDLNLLLFNPQQFPSDRMLVEFAPYVTQLEHPPVLPHKFGAASGYPKSGVSGGEWQVVLARLADAPVTLGSSKLDARRYQLKGSRQTANGIGRFEMTMWYAPEAKRYVRMEHKAWNAISEQTADVVVELLELPPR